MPCGCVAEILSVQLCQSVCFTLHFHEEVVYVSVRVSSFLPFQLLGHIDVDTREWTDGVLTSSSREVVRESGDIHSWIVCDGDIDPEWIESLNSVLDDNRQV